MFYCPPKYEKKLPNVNQELLKLKGELSDKDTRVTLARFLRHNIGLTTEAISGITLAPYQEITLKAFFNRDFSLCVWGRGCAKSFLAAVYCFLYAIFQPGSKILIAGPTFRTARNIFTELEKIVKNKNATLLAQAFNAEPPSHKNDLYYWRLANDSTITAIPLNGDKIRGFRAHVLILDEFLLLSEDMVKNVLIPFLFSPANVGERLKVKEMEDEFIKNGLMKEEDRSTYRNTNKLLCFSSASYSFEYLYTCYKEWVSNIYDETPLEQDSSTYFVSQIGYRGIPPQMVEKAVIQEASNGGLENPGFLREYCAQFTDGSQGYFSAKKMNECTIPDCQDPHLKLMGDSDKKYIIAIDPSFSNSPSSDNFAMAVLEIDHEHEGATLVHNYALAGGNLKDHINYFCYLYSAFNPEMIICDNADGNFIDAVNECQWMKERRVSLSFVEEWDVSKQESDYVEMLKVCKNKFNKEAGRICISFVFGSDSIRRGNEHLQSCIDSKKIWFGSRIRPDGNYFERVIHQKLPLTFKEDETIGDLIDRQDELIIQVKKECALIEVKTNPQGTQTFDLPQHLKRSTAASRARRDSYTALMLGNWGIRCYFDLIHYQPQEIITTFTPVFIK